MKRKIIFVVGLIIVSIIFILLGVLMWNKVPNTVEHTPKEGFMMFGSIMSIVFGIAGIICSFIYLSEFMDD